MAGLSAVQTLLFVATLAAVAVEGLPDLGNFNGIFDAIIQSNVVENKDQIDPIEVPQQSKKFERKIGFLRIHGVVSLENVILYGMSTLRRSGEATIIDRPDGDGHEIILRMAVGEIRYGGNFKAQFMGIGPYRRFDGSYNHLDMEVRTWLDKDGVARLSKFDIYGLDGVRFKISGDLRPLNAVANVGAKVVLKLFQNSVRRVTESIARRVVHKIMAHPDFAAMIG